MAHLITSTTLTRCSTGGKRNHPVNSIRWVLRQSYSFIGCVKGLDVAERTISKNISTFCVNQMNVKRRNVRQQVNDTRESFGRRKKKNARSLSLSLSPWHPYQRKNVHKLYFRFATKCQPLTNRMSYVEHLDVSQTKCLKYSPLVKCRWFMSLSRHIFEKMLSEKPWINQVDFQWFSVWLWPNWNSDDITFAIIQIWFVWVLFCVGVDLVSWLLTTVTLKLQLRNNKHHTHTHSHTPTRIIITILPRRWKRKHIVH